MDTSIRSALNRVWRKIAGRSSELSEFLECAQDSKSFDLIDERAAWDGDWVVYVSDSAVRIGLMGATVYDSTKDGKDNEVLKAAKAVYEDAKQRSDT